MYIDGFSVDSLGSFRAHFSLTSLMDYWMQPVVFRKWMRALRNGGSLDKASLSYLDQLEKAFSYWCGEKEAFDVPRPCSLPCSRGENRIFFRALDQRLPEAPPRALNACYMAWLLLELGQCTATQADLHCLLAYAADDEWLWIRADPEPVLYRGSREIERLPSPMGLDWFGDLITAAQDPDTGFLGITREGKLYNGSALSIAPPETRVVKATLCQNCYALLLEDGTVVHNLRWEPPLPQRVETVSLQGDRLLYTAF